MPRAKKLKCPKCDRTFSMPGHLGRHMAATHGAAAKTAGSRARPSRMPSSGSGTIVQQLQAYQAELTAQRAGLDQQIAAVAAALAAMSPNAATDRPAPGSSRGRGRDGSLKEFVARALRQSSVAMRIKDIAAAVVRIGYQTKNKTLGTSVGIALPHIAGVVRVSRGMYRMA